MSKLHKLWIKDRLMDWPPFRGHRRRRQAEAWAAWQRQPGSGAAPHLAKEYAVINYAQRFNARMFVETGVLFGEMLIAARPYFNKLYSIELDPDLCHQAQKRLSKHTHISILEGDSGLVLPQLIQQIDEPALFWLDGHYSGGVTAQGDLDTPIATELDAVLSHPIRNHVILIDDARCFDGTNDYPRLDDLEARVRERRPDLHWETSHDMIRILPSAGNA